MNFYCLNDYEHGFRCDQQCHQCASKQEQVAAPVNYNSPLETICPSCGGKHVGHCGLHACKSNERDSYIGR